LAADVTRDDRFLFVGLTDGQVVVLDLLENRELHRFHLHKYPVAAIRILSEDRVLTVAARCREIIVWIRDQDNVWRCGEKRDLLKHDNIVDLRLDHSGSNVLGLVSVSQEAKGATVEPLSERILGGKSKGFPPDVKFSLRPISTPSPPDSTASDNTILTSLPVSRIFDICATHLVVADSYDSGGDNSVVVYNLARRTIECRLPTQCGTVFATVISRNGRFVAVSGHLGAEVFDRASGERLAAMDDSGRCWVKMFVGEEGDLLVHTETADLFFSMSDQQVIARFPLTARISRLRFSTAGRHRLRTMKTGIEVASLVSAENRHVATHTTTVGDVLFSPDGSLVATSGGDDHDDPVRLWDSVSGRLIREIEGNQVAFHPSGKLLAIKTKNQIHIWNVPSGTLAATAAAPVPIYRLRFNARGDLLAGVGWSHDGFVAWRISSPAAADDQSDTDAVRIEPALSNNDGYWDFSWSPSGRRLARHLNNGRIRIDDFDQPELSFELDHGSGKLNFRCLVFLNEDRLGFVSERFELWDLNRRERLADQSRWSERPFTTSPNTVSPDGRLLTFKNVLIDAQSMRPLFTLPIPEATLWCADWSPDGRRLAFGFHGGNLIIWDLAMVQERLATVGLDWDALEYRQLKPMAPLSQLLTSSTNESTLKQDEHWAARLRQISELATGDGPAPKSLAKEIERLIDDIPLGGINRFEAPDRAAEHIEQLVKFGIDLKSGDNALLAERLLKQTIDLVESREYPAGNIQLSLSRAHHVLGDLYAYSLSDTATLAAEAYQQEQELLEQLREDQSESHLFIPGYRLFWMNHNYASALTKTGNRVAGIERLDQALKLWENDRSIVTNHDMSNSYETLMNWLEKENRNDDSKAIRKRARKLGLLKE